MRFDTNHCLWYCLQHHLLYVHAYNYMNMMWYELLLSDSMLLFKNNIESSSQVMLLFKNNKKSSSWIMLLFKNNKHVLLEIYQIKIESFYMLAWKWNHEIFAVIMKNIEKVLNLKSYINSWLFISKKYHDLINVFEKKETDKLIFYWEKYDIEIDLKLNKMSKFKSLYNMSWKELQMLCEYFDEQLTKKFI